MTTGNRPRAKKPPVIIELYPDVQLIHPPGKEVVTHRVVRERRGRCSSKMMFVIRIVVPVVPVSFVSLSDVPPVPDVPEVSEIPEVAVPKVTEVSGRLATAHVVPFISRLPRHRRRLLLLRVGQQLLDSTATSATSSTTSATGGMTPEVTPSYLLLRPTGDFASGQPSRAWCPHDRSASNLLPPRPPGGLHHITIKGYPARSSHDPTLPRPPLVLDFELFLVLEPLVVRGLARPRIGTVSLASTAGNAAGGFTCRSRRG